MDILSLTWGIEGEDRGGAVAHSLHLWLQVGGSWV